jgi:hypothetical protein
LTLPQWQDIVTIMLWFGLTKTLRDLEDRVRKLEIETPSTVAALENAADLYNRAAARAERTKPRDEDNGDGLLAVRKRRGGW